MQSARLTVGDIPLRYVELRMANGKPVGVVESAGRLAQFDVTTGQIITTGPSRRTDPDSPNSERNTFKHFHRMTVFGKYALFINVIVGVGLATLIVTGLILYFKMLSGRSRSTASNPFWSGGGWWRIWHRRISVVAALFLTVVTLSGLWLAYESLYAGFYVGSAQQRAAIQQFSALQEQRAGNPPRPRPDPMSAEAQPSRLASMKLDIGLTDDEMVKIKAISDELVKKNLDLQKDMGSVGAIRPKTMGLHQEEANAIMAVLTDDQKPKFQAWRDAQLLGTPLPTAGRGNGGQQGTGGQQGNGGAKRADGQGGQNVGPGGPGGGGNPATAVDASSPIKDAELGAMLHVTIAALQLDLPKTPIKVIRLRYFGGMPQGVVVTGGDTTKQVVFNAQTGKAVSESEPGYPPAYFPFGWQAHQIAKDVHRGGIIGLPGRFMDLFAGLSLIYLSISGGVMYFNLWRARRRGGRTAMFWT